MIPKRVWFSVILAALCHGLFILTARYQLSYDAYTHMFFADHYAGNWFSLWEPRWYTGFSVASYPPLIHQLIAIFVPFLGLDKAFALILWIVVSLYPLGLYGFSRIFAGKAASSYSALAGSVLLSIYVVAYTFGQLPFMASTLIALFAAAALNKYLRNGGAHKLITAISLLGASMGMHHATMMIHPFLITSVIGAGFFKRDYELSSWKTYFSRFTLYFFGAISIAILVILPFWLWGIGQDLQTPIDHLSRHNYFESPSAILFFLLPLYGPLIITIPFIFRKWTYRFLGLQISFVFLFILGLGGTTHLPRVIFGNAWEWLTYDRFSFWGGLILIPFFGILFIRYTKWFRAFIKPIQDPFPKIFSAILVFSIFAATSLGSWLIPYIFPTQPKPVNLLPIAEFLDQPEHVQWRYLTLGFGDQFARLSVMTNATTLDGSYHTARTIPELRYSGLGQLDTAYWAENGIQRLHGILNNSGKYSVRWAFVNPATFEGVPVRWGEIHRSPYVPLLEDLGWNKYKILSNAIVVYENSLAAKEINIPPVVMSLLPFLWGVIPMLIFVIAVASASLQVWPAETEEIIRKIYCLLIGLVPISICFLNYVDISDVQYRRVYFTYNQSLTYLADAFVLLAVVLWLLVRVANPKPAKRNLLSISLGSLWAISILSTTWSNNPTVSLLFSLHLGLIVLFALSLYDFKESWLFGLYGLCGFLVVQAVVGYTMFSLQSTAFLENLKWEWPGLIDPNTNGASVVQLSNGIRILRSYGTLPHPNILGGFSLIAIFGATSLYFEKIKPTYPAILLSAFAAILLVLSFSRSAWLGICLFLIIILLKHKSLGTRQTWLFVIANLIAFTISLYFLRGFVHSRVIPNGIPTEELSLFGRRWLTEQALESIKDHMIVGVGAGSFIFDLARYAPEGAFIEPVHNLFLLMWAELGITGIISIIGLIIFIGKKILEENESRSVLSGALLASIGLICLFDHYFWSTAPGRIMLGLSLGLWMGRISNDT